MPPSRLAKHGRKLDTSGCARSNTLTLLLFHFYDMALGLQWSCDPLTNGDGGSAPSSSIQLTLHPCHIVGKLHQRLFSKTIYCQDSICCRNMWWLSRPWRSQEKKKKKKKDTVTGDENKFMQADNNKE